MINRNSYVAFLSSRISPIGLNKFDFEVLQQIIKIKNKEFCLLKLIDSDNNELLAQTTLKILI